MIQIENQTKYEEIEEVNFTIVLFKNGQKRLMLNCFDT